MIRKALSADPADRYADTNDLDRILTYRPIIARPPGTLTRLVRFLQRHRSAVVAASAAALLVAGLAIWLLMSHGVSVSFIEHGVPRPQALADALEHHDRALGFDPDNRRAAIERAVVMVARSLLLERSIDLESRALLSSFCPATLTWGAVQGASDVKSAILDETSGEDRRAFGLLAYLLDDPETCTQAWSGLDLAAHPDQLVDAILGELYLTRRQPALAFPRLLRSSEAFPGSSRLNRRAADAACQVGDLSVARRLIAQARLAGGLDPYGTLRRLEAEDRPCGFSKLFKRNRGASRSGSASLGERGPVSGLHFDKRVSAHEQRREFGHPEGGEASVGPQPLLS